MVSRLSLEGRIALVTGAGGGMGRSHASLLAERGADVIVHDRKEAIEETAEIVRAKGHRALAIQVDIRDVTALQSAFRSAIADFGPIDILINNAGVGGPRRSVAEIDPDIFNEMFEVNVRGTFFATQALIPTMIERGYGRIVNISSTYAMGGAVFSSHYAASKAAISGFTKSWARELAAHKITVNAVAPGFISGRWLQDGLGEGYEETKQAFEKTMPLQAVCDPEDVAAAIVSLVEGSDLVTGQILGCDGGMSIAEPASI